MKRGANDNCPDCGNLYSFVHGSCMGVACRIEGCGIGYATSCIPGFVSDATDYVCYVERLPSDWMRALAWMGNRFHIPLSQLRSYKDNPSLPLITRKARELYHLRSEFVEHGIEIRIEPEFTYSEYDVAPRRESPLNTEHLDSIREFLHRDDTGLHEIEKAWFESAAAAVVEHVKAHPEERFYAGSIWLCYVDYTMFGTPCFALNTESHIAEAGSDLRWSPADWRFSCIDSTVGAMQPLYSSLSRHLAGRSEAYWDLTIKEHFACLAQVCRRITNHARTRSGVFASINLPEDFVVGIFEFRENDPLFTQLITDSIAPEILAKLSDPVWPR